MDRMLFIAMRSASEITTSQTLNTNNLANASTVGFKADFQTSLSQQVYGPGHPSRVYASVASAGTDLSQGSIVSTGRDLDVAINGKGWIAVQTSDGGEAYTRAGNLLIDSVGRLTNATGHFIMGNGGPISLPAHAKLQIGSDGTISIQPLGQAASALAVIDRIKLINPADDQLEKGRDGLMHMRAGQNAEVDASVGIVSGSLESSNVSTVTSLVKMIELARQYEMHVKVMQSTEENDRASAEIMKMS